MSFSHNWFKEANTSSSCLSKGFIWEGESSISGLGGFHSFESCQLLFLEFFHYSKVEDFLSGVGIFSYNLSLFKI